MVRGLPDHTEVWMVCRPLRYLWFGSCVLLFGCAPAAAPAPSLQGSSRGVRWEVSDIGQIATADGKRMRWSYVIRLHGMAGSEVQFERVETGSYSDSGQLIGG